MMIDNQQAEKFLKYLDRNTYTFTYQLFHDTPRGQAGRVIHGTTGELIKESEGGTEGIAIAVTVNETRDGSRKSEDVVRVRAVWHDNDKSYGGGFPLRPSLSVRTSEARFHYYWLVDGEWLADDRGREDFRRVMATMVEGYGSDKNASDISRALRLPGTFNCKGKPFKTHIVWDNRGKPVRYTREEIVAAFGEDRYEGEKPPLPAPARSSIPIEIDKLREALAHIPSEDRNDWLRVGMGLHHQFDGSEGGFQIWDEWSRGTRSANYDPGDQRRAWENFGKRHRSTITIRTVFHLARQNGWVEVSDQAPIPEQNVTIERQAGDLAERTIKAVRNFFEDGSKSSPSADHFNGLGEIAKVIQAMAEGDTALGRDFLVSSLPAGMGKTTTIREAVREIVRTPAYDDVGVIVFLSRVEEIERLVNGMGLKETEFATMVSQNYEDKVPLGNPVVGNARVLFTTQQQLEARLRDRKQFGEEKEFHFKGKPRQVRIWDEAILPSRGLVVSQWDISSLFRGVAGAGHSKLVGELEDLYETVRNTRDREVIEIPNLTGFGVSVDDARSLFKEDDNRNAVEALWKLSGRKVRFRKDNRKNVVLGYEEAFE